MFEDIFREIEKETFFPDMTTPLGLVHQGLNSSISSKKTLSQLIYFLDLHICLIQVFPWCKFKNQ